MYLPCLNGTGSMTVFPQALACDCRYSILGCSQRLILLESGTALSLPKACKENIHITTLNWNPTNAISFYTVGLHNNYQITS